MSLNGAVLAGMVAGAATMVALVALTARNGVFRSSLITLGDSGTFQDKLRRGALLYATMGAILGFTVVVTGHAWWEAIVASAGIILTTFAVDKILTWRV